MERYLKDNTVKYRKDINAMMREMMSGSLKGTLDSKLDEELGYSKYDYRNKDTNNGHSKKTAQSYEDMELDIPHDRNGSYEPQVIKKYPEYPYTGYFGSILRNRYTDIQHCIIHQIRNSTKFVSYKDLKPLMTDLKRVVYTALQKR